jgi:hypothetical protein
MPVGDTTDKRSRLLGDYVVLEDFAGWDHITHMIRTLERCLACVGQKSRGYEIEGTKCTGCLPRHLRALVGYKISYSSRCRVLAYL